MNMKNLRNLFRPGIERNAEWNGQVGERSISDLLESKSARSYPPTKTEKYQVLPMRRIGNRFIHFTFYEQAHVRY